MPKLEYEPSEMQADLELGLQFVDTICALIDAYMLF